MLLKLASGAFLHPRRADPDPNPAWLGGLIAVKGILGVLSQEFRGDVELWQSGCSTVRLRDEALTTAQLGGGGQWC